MPPRLRHCMRKVGRHQSRCLDIDIQGTVRCQRTHNPRARRPARDGGALLCAKQKSSSRCLAISVKLTDCQPPAQVEPGAFCCLILPTGTVLGKQ